MSFGKFASFTQFVLYGKQYCTATGYESTRAKYPKPDILDDTSMTLEDKVFIITGANAGIGREITQYLATKRATVYMFCRSPERASKAQEEIIKISNNDRVFVLLGDCGLESDIRRMFSEFVRLETERKQIAEGKTPTLNGLICNAGALMNKKTLTAEGIEITLATHLLFGVFLLGTLCIPLLDNTPDSRLICVSSGGMYNTAFPAWEDASSTGSKEYDGNMAYAYAKRGQVLLCERWAQMYPKIKVVSCHPGWVATEAVDAAYGEQKKYLEPMRNTWQGSEGIIWLCVVKASEIESGAFYLDRAPSKKHIAGPFFTEGTYTKNTTQEVDAMYANLTVWSDATTRPTAATIKRLISINKPLQAITDVTLNIPRFMGVWYVLANIPSKFEIGSTNCIENYSWNFEEGVVNVLFEYVAKSASSFSGLSMKGEIINENNTHWKISPKVAGLIMPLSFDYLIIDLPEDYSYVTVGVPDRSMIWIMIREKPRVAVSEDDLIINLSSSDVANASETASSSVSASSSQDSILKVAIEKAAYLGYDTTKVRKCFWKQEMDKEPYVPNRRA